MRAIQLKTKPSRTLLITGVKDIGLRSESIDCGWGDFASGRTSALFQSLGTWPSLMSLSFGRVRLCLYMVKIFQKKSAFMSIYGEDLSILYTKNIKVHEYQSKLR